VLALRMSVPRGRGRQLPEWNVARCGGGSNKLSNRIRTTKAGMHTGRGTSTGCPVSVPGDVVDIGRLKIVCERPPEDDTTAASVWGKS
jgi:hypothetical protein